MLETHENPVRVWTVCDDCGIRKEAYRSSCTKHTLKTGEYKCRSCKKKENWKDGKYAFRK